MKNTKIKVTIENVKDSENYHHGNLKSALIEAGLKILKNEGAHKLSLREIAKVAGVTHMAPYRHFENKEALLADIAENGFKLLKENIEQNIEEYNENPRQQLIEISKTYVRIAIENPEYFNVMFGGFISEQSKYENLEKISAQTFDRFIYVIKEGQKSGMIRDDEPKQIAVTLWSMLHGIANLLINESLIFLNINSEKYEDYLDKMINLFISGIKKKVLISEF